MKNLFTLALISFVTLISCTKEANQEEEHEIDGKWLWEKSVGGIGGITITPDEGFSRVVEFIDDSTYSITENNILLIEDSYTVKSGTDIETNAEAKIITFYNTSNPSVGFPVIPHVLILSKVLKLKENILDGYTHSYRRIIETTN